MRSSHLFRNDSPGLRNKFRLSGDLLLLFSRRRKRLMIPTGMNKNPSTANNTSIDNTLPSPESAYSSRRVLCLHDSITHSHGDQLCERLSGFAEDIILAGCRRMRMAFFFFSGLFCGGCWLGFF